jgi:hypothetical protein
MLYFIMMIELHVYNANKQIFINNLVLFSKTRMFKWNITFISKKAYIVTWYLSFW